MVIGGSDDGIQTLLSLGLHHFYNSLAGAAPNRGEGGDEVEDFHWGG
jgi:hypothetical protein